MESAEILGLVIELVVYGGLFFLIGVAGYCLGKWEDRKREQKKIEQGPNYFEDSDRIPHIRW